MRITCFVKHGDVEDCEEVWVKRRFTVRDEDFQKIKKVLSKFEAKFFKEQDC